MNNIKKQFLENYKKYGVLSMEFQKSYLYALARKEFGTSKFLKLPDILETSYQRDINFYDEGRKYYQKVFQVVRKYFKHD